MKNLNKEYLSWQASIADLYEDLVNPENFSGLEDILFQMEEFFWLESSRARLRELWADDSWDSSKDF